MRALFLLTIFLSTTPLLADQMQESGINWKAIRTLNGVFALHDGPNCYNSTLIAKGYTQIISQTGDEELKYYLWTFCDRENGPPKVGDIIVKTVGIK